MERMDNEREIRGRIEESEKDNIEMIRRRDEEQEPKIKDIYSYIYSTIINKNDQLAHLQSEIET